MTQALCPLAEAAEKFDKNPALITASKVITYREYDRRVSEVAANLQRLGIQPGTRVALALKTGVDFPIIFFAIVRVGAIACPLNTRLPKDAMLEQMRHIGCTTIICERGVVAPTDLSLSRLDKAALKVKSTAMVGPHEFRGEDPVTIIFTGGSSGRSKAVMHSYANHFFNAKGANERIPFEVGDRWLLSLPLFHVGGLGILFRAIINGGAVVITEDQEDLPEVFRKFNITHVSMVATQLYRLLKERHKHRFLAPTVKAILMGGGPVSDSLLVQAMDTKLPMHVSYGCTEMASQIATTSHEDNPSRLFTVGKALNYRQLMVSQMGEILVKGRTLAMGYVEGDELIKLADSKGWFHTGDIGILTDDDYLIVAGRLDNMFISGGENIQPEEIELTVAEFEGISRVVVVPVPDEEFGARPVAFVETASHGVFSPDQIAKQLRQKLPGYKIPVAWYKWPENGGGYGLKPNRAKLAELAQQLISRQMNQGS